MRWSPPPLTDAGNFHRKDKTMSIKHTLNLLDERLLKELLDAAQEALNDTATAKRVAHMLGVEPARVHALANVALGLSQAEDERAHDVGTLRQLDSLTTRIRGLMSS
ncbi:hypothetical protein SAMN05216189_100456 [Pseudomonas delhiensis]|uniref:Uncharacterized protein n=2 Tax=Pseudomonas delhiensis TaxID=366289 RepID=A0A239EA82_9PSED|nr:hypothetical protein SAMN05216189_100456 [Pseudomonas delhiensis]SNS41188.1 hypothetical protein SAMN06295949_101315 [Pseudomonas delhiensis]